MQLHLHCRCGAADPAVVLVDEAAQPEGTARLLQVAMQIADGDDAGHCRQDGPLRCLLQHSVVAQMIAARSKPLHSLQHGCMKLTPVFNKRQRTSCLMGSASAVDLSLETMLARIYTAAQM